MNTDPPSRHLSNRPLYIPSSASNHNSASTLVPLVFLIRSDRLRPILFNSDRFLSRLDHLLLTINSISTLASSSSIHWFYICILSSDLEIQTPNDVHLLGAFRRSRSFVVQLFASISYIYGVQTCARNLQVARKFCASSLKHLA
ncbi:uncharacterized protein MELLADRAFT_73612 [Melampsora larici-populina 98AG31]|uniref:Uncharacterized protein n=1 Tax=Melampsora larici-populina (strain 98AG31 / pathotype 3-4-7) TaxID=747676 RepID=F4SAE9_MELLP|nr:uncharacterized protein MELLADRAFT_73612 [Melampsora larici-populina 98AG31]EGF98374.1 hypothetical protein MELLADRAFT_73612 [Melampsora larici-populina 98AG31]